MMVEQFLFNNGLQEVDLQLFLAELKPLRLKKGEKFIPLGQVSKFIAFIEYGFLRTYHLNEGGKEVTTDFNQPDTFCGSYYSFYAQQPAFEIVEAITACELHLLSYNALQKLYAESFQINVFGRTVLEKACIERDLRLKKIMHLSAKEKYEWFLERYAEVYKIAKLGHIASFLGVNPETLSRVRRSFIS